GCALGGHSVSSRARAALKDTTVSAGRPRAVAPARPSQYGSTLYRGCGTHGQKTHNGSDNRGAVSPRHGSASQDENHTRPEGCGSNTVTCQEAQHADLQGKCSISGTENWFFGPAVGGRPGWGMAKILLPEPLAACPPKFRVDDL